LESTFINVVFLEAFEGVGGGQMSRVADVEAEERLTVTQKRLVSGLIHIFKIKLCVTQ
jgi:hypothetical protein